MVVNLYSDFDTPLTIRPVETKTFYEDQFNWSSLKTNGVKSYSKVIEETVVLKHEQKWVNAQLIGVDSTFIEMTHMPKHMVDGYPTLKENNKDVGIIGASLLDKLEGFIPEGTNYETLLIYAPKRDMKMRLGKNPFSTRLLSLSGRMNFNREVNAEFIVVPFELASEIMDYKKELTAIYLDVQEGFDKNDVKLEIQKKLGANFVVKTNYEKNELIFKTSQSERVIVLIILLFIFILASFNLVASLTMLFVEKKDNLDTLKAMGANDKSIFNIFFFEGLMIAFKGIVFGLILGYLICVLQLQFGLLQMPNSGGEAFPIAITFSDGLLIFLLVSGLSAIASYFPVKLLIRRNSKQE